MVTVCELQIKAKAKGLKGYSKMRKAELMKFVEGDNEEATPPTKKKTTKAKTEAKPEKKKTTKATPQNLKALIEKSKKKVLAIKYTEPPKEEPVKKEPKKESKKEPKKEPKDEIEEVKNKIESGDNTTREYVVEFIKGFFANRSITLKKRKEFKQLYEQGRYDMLGRAQNAKTSINNVNKVLVGLLRLLKDNFTIKQANEIFTKINSKMKNKI